MHPKFARKSREHRDGPFSPGRISLFFLPRRSSHLGWAARRNMDALPPSSCPQSSSRPEWEVGSGEHTRPSPRSAFHAGHAAQSGTSQARQDAVCYERIVDFPAFPHSALLYYTDRMRRRSYSSWDSRKSERSNGRPYVRNSSRRNPSRLPEGKLSEKTIDTRRAIASAWILGGSRGHFVLSLWFLSWHVKPQSIYLP